MGSIQRCRTEVGNKTISFLDAGPRDGTLIVLVHGWPAIAETWKPQIDALIALGFRVVAPDMLGYGHSTKSRNQQDYSMENLVRSLLSLLEHLERSQAIWIGHDWGAAVVWALVAHHPEACMGVICLCVPYRTMELGIKAMVELSNRDLYPEEEYPHAQWDYQVFYEDEQNYEKTMEVFAVDIDALIRFLYARARAEDSDKPARCSTISRDGGWFGGNGIPPNVPLIETALNNELYEKLTSTFRENGFWAPTAWYLNHDTNREWGQKSSINDGIVAVPTLFIEALRDNICGTYNSRLSEPMRAFCSKLTEVSIDAGHWVALEAPEQTNAAIVNWLATTLPESWPFYKQNHFK